jgi:hypothetical protein
MYQVYRMKACISYVQSVTPLPNYLYVVQICFSSSISTVFSAPCPIVFFYSLMIFVLDHNLIEERNIEIKLTTYGPQEQNGPVILVVNSCCSRDTKENVVGAGFALLAKMLQNKRLFGTNIHIQGVYKYTQFFIFFLNENCFANNCPNALGTVFCFIKLLSKTVCQTLF